MPPSIPSTRVRRASDHPVRPERSFVLYWMTAARRTTYNFSLQHAARWSAELGKPLVVLEALRLDYPWANDRLHSFVMQGMADNSRALRARPVTYYPYVEPARGAGKGLLRALASDACLVITDDVPTFFLPRMLGAAAEQVDVRVEAVDTNGVVPQRAAGRAHRTAHAFRRFTHAYLVEHGLDMPVADPLAGLSLPMPDGLPPRLLRRWPTTEVGALDPPVLAKLDIDHGVLPSPQPGGPRAAVDRLGQFLDRGLARYERDRNHPDRMSASGLSPYLHFGHVGVHQVLDPIMRSGEWRPDDVERIARGSRAGWGGAPAAGAFLDQLITWRELGYNMCAYRADFDRYEALPYWALTTLGEHADDPRDRIYTLDQFDRAETHDELWNAAQRQLSSTGTLHNYLRMLWGKKILEWTRSPRDALAVMLELNNRYALDGRDPNSYAGIFWTLGRYDRAWGPERRVFGKVRFMSSANTRRKLQVKGYLERFGP